jgi:hypothetical protein
MWLKVEVAKLVGGVLLDSVADVVTIFECIVTWNFGLALVGRFEEFGVFVAKEMVAIGVDVVVVTIVNAGYIKSGGLEEIGLVEDVVLSVHQGRSGFDKSVQRAEGVKEEFAVVPPGVGAGAHGNAKTVTDVVAVFGLGGKKVVFIKDGRPLDLEEDRAAGGLSVTQIKGIWPSIATVEESVVVSKFVAFILILEGEVHDARLPYNLVQMADLPVDVVSVKSWYRGGWRRGR